jgi:sigma-B regulation protein RsbU (phosphoserine phosphatase)
VSGFRFSDVLMKSSYYYRLRDVLRTKGLLPRSLIGRIATYLLAIDLFLFLLQRSLRLFSHTAGSGLGGWIQFLTMLGLVLLAFPALRWVRAKLLWRLRNRLIVTYTFIGVVPVVLLVIMAIVSIYLFAGQFATFVVTTDIESQLKRLEASNSAIANELAVRLSKGEKPDSTSVEGLRRERTWGTRMLTAWYGNKEVLRIGPANTPVSLPKFLPAQFADLVHEGDKFYLRVSNTLTVGQGKLTVISGRSMDHELLANMATNLGEVSLLYATGLIVPEPNKSGASTGSTAPGGQGQNGITVHRTEAGGYSVNGGRPAFFHTVARAGALPTSSGVLDRELSFGNPIPAVDWNTGEKSMVVIHVNTRPSLLYGRLFASLGNFASSVEIVLAAIAIVFAVIELAALLIGMRLTRTMTRSVGALYTATQHINRGDFTHRIPVRSHDQLATLEASFNSMTESLQKLLAEQKEKQRLESELAIAQEVQAQLFPRQTSELDSLEVYGLCRPARTVSGDYYDFLTLPGEKMGLAVGDVSGKGISAALLMATIHSAVRAYSLESVPALSLPAAVGAGRGLGEHAQLQGAEVSPRLVMYHLNRQLYHSTRPEKYATLFYSIFDGRSRRLTYSNAGHLPPVVLGSDGSLRRLDSGGTVVGLFDEVTFEESSTELRPGDLFFAYSDGLTEPENEYGEFGEERLIDLVIENRSLSLDRISEAVNAAILDWIGGNEQPDDVTLVLARAR